MSEQRSAEIAARLDRLPPSRTVWTMVILISLGGARHPAVRLASIANLR